MKMAEMLSSNFLELVYKHDPKIYVLFQKTDIDDNNRALVEGLRDNENARKNFLQIISKNLFQVLPDRFIKALRKKDKMTCKLLSMAPAQKYSPELKETFKQAFKKEKVQDLVLSWFNNTDNTTLSRYKLLNLTMDDIAETALTKADKLTVNTKVGFFAHEACPPIVFNSKENEAWNRVDTNRKINDYSGPA